MHCQDCPSKGNSLFCGSHPECLDILARDKVHQDLRPGECLQLPDTRPKGVYCIEKGVLQRKCKSGPAQPPKLIEFLGPGKTVGSLEILSAQPPASIVEARHPTRVCFIPERTFREAAEISPDVETRVFQAASERIDILQEIVLCLKYKTAAQRVAKGVLYLSKFPDDVRWTRRDIAQLCNTSTETAIRVTRKLTDQGLLHFQSGRIHIPDEAKLISYLESTAGADQD